MKYPAAEVISVGYAVGRGQVAAEIVLAGPAVDVNCEHCGSVFTFRPIEKGYHSVIGADNENNRRRTREGGVKFVEARLRSRCPVQTCPHCGHLQKEMRKQFHKDSRHLACRAGSIITLGLVAIPLLIHFKTEPLQRDSHFLFVTMGLCFALGVVATLGIAIGLAFRNPAKHYPSMPAFVLDEDGAKRVSNRDECLTGTGPINRRIDQSRR